MKKFISNLKLFLLLAAMVAGVSDAFAAWPGSGQGTKGSDGKYYVLNASSEISVGLWGTSDALNLSGPGAVLTFQAKRQTGGFNAGFYAQQSTDNGSNWSKLCDISCTTSYTDKSQNISSDVTSIRFKHDSPGSLTKYARNIKVTMAQYLEDPSASKLDFGTAKVNDAATNRTFTVAWCNVPALSYSVSGNGSENVSVAIDNNAEVGKYNTATITVTYSHTQASTLNATLTLTDSYNGYSKNITLTGQCNKKPQTISWDDEVVNTNISTEEADRNISSYVTYSGKLGRTPYFTSSDEEKLKVLDDGITIHPVAQGSATITAHMDGDDEYAEAISTAKTFTVSQRSTPHFTVNNVYNLYVGDSFEVRSNNNRQNSLMTCAAKVASDIYSFSSSANATEGVGVVTALKEGSVELQFAQAATDGWNPGTSEWVIVNIARHPTTISVNTDAQTILVGDSYDPAFSTTNNEVIVDITSSNPAVTIYEDGVIKALAAGTATLTFSQTENTKWTGDTKTIAVTVNKHNPNLHATNIPATNWNNTIIPAFETENIVSEIVLTQLDGQASAKLVDGNIVVYNVEGTAHFRATQEATDYYAAAQYDFDVVVAHADNHVRIDMSQAYYNSYVTKSSNSKISWNNGIRFAKGGAGFNWDDEYVVVGFQGVPSQLNLSFEEQAGVTGDGWYITESPDGVNFGDNLLAKRTDKDQTPSISLKPSTRFVKVGNQWNMTSTIKSLSVSERSEVLADDYDFGTFEVGATATARNIPMKWYNVPTLTITSSNPAVFEVTTSTITAGIDSYDENAAIGITYHHNTVSPADGDEATITIVSANGVINETFTVSGKTIKKNQTITWTENISPMTVGKIHVNPASAALPLNYEVVAGGESFLEIVNGNEVKAIGVGTATVRVYNSGDETWNAVEDTYTFTVTELKVQRIEWLQSFTHLRTGSENVELASVVYDVPADEAQTPVVLAHPVTYNSQDENVVKVVNGNELQIVGVGTTTVTAYVAEQNGYIETSEVHPVIVRDPSAGCEMFVLEDKSGAIGTIGEKVFDLSGEPETVNFEAWASFLAVGDLHLSEYYDGAWHEIWEGGNHTGAKSYGPVSMNRRSTKIKFHTNVGATLTHSFSGVYVTLANYLEFTDAPDATAVDVDFPAAETQIGQTYTKTVNIRYSDIFDQLAVTHTNSKFMVTPTTIGECGDHGTATITIQYHATVEGTEEDVITITDRKTTRTINVSATTQKNDQTITFAPAESMNTTDNVTLSATASSGLSVVFEQVSGEEFATVNAAGVVSVVKGGGAIVVRASQEGSALYNAAPSVEKTIYINKVTPTITTLPTVSAVTLPATLADATIDGASAVVTNDKGTAVAGTFAWTDATINAAAGTNTYSAIFTPENTNYYNSATCDLSVTANKLSQTIAWPLADNSEFNYFQTVPMDAAATSGLTVSYASSDEDVAKIVAGAVQFVAPGSVTLTASQAGNATYEAAADVVRTITIVKATPAITTIPNMVVFYEGHSLSESPIVGGVAEVEGNAVDGTFSWKEDATPAVGDDYTFPAVFTPNNTVFFNTVECMVPVRVTVYDRVFTDATGNHLWSDPLNWSNGFVPESVADATIDGPVIINTNVTIDELTIEEGAKVLVVESGSLTVGHSGTSSTGTYGDLYVKDAATVTFNGAFELNDFYLASLLDSYEGKSSSGQVNNPENLLVDGDVYFDLQIDASGECSPGWYDFTVPFPVDALNGVYRIENGVETKVTNEVNYAIMSYHEDVRAQGKYGWKKFRGIMQPGVCYSITIDNVYPVYRFRKTADGVFNTANTILMTYTEGEGGAENQGWNCLGNGTLRHANLSAAGISKVQVYDHASNGYTPVEINECSFVVGAAFFVQAPQETNIMNFAPATNNTLRAPSREVMSEEHRLTLSRADGTMVDRLYLSAADDASATYEVGHDLAKFEVSNQTAQMWCDAYGTKLCDVELPLLSDQAVFDLSMSTPVAGDYVLSADRSVNNETLYLMQNGVIVWNLSMSDYSVSLTKGTSSEYSILLVRQAPGVATDVENVADSAADVEKLMINGRLYILRDSRLYDAQGRLVK